MAIQTPVRGRHDESEQPNGPRYEELAHRRQAHPRRVSRRKRYLAGYGVAALIIAAGSATALLVSQPPAQERAPVQAKHIAATASGAPVRDQWYSETPAATNAQRLAEQPRDRWYLDEPAAPGASRSAAPARDRWYLDDRN